MTKRITIIGGMGPQASLLLHQNIIQAAAHSGAREGHDFPEIAHFSLPIADFISHPTSMKQAINQIVGSLERLYPWRRLAGYSL